MVALVVATRDSTGMGIARAGPDGLDEPRELGSLALVLAAARRDVLAAPPVQTVACPEVVEPRAAAAARGVQRLLREAGVAARDVADGAARAVLEPHSDLHIVLLRAGNGVDLLGQAVRPPAQRVDEVAAFADEPRSLQRRRCGTSCRRPAVPRSPGNGSTELAPGGPNCDFMLREHRRETPVEAHHQPVVAGLRDDLDDPVELVAGQRERLFDEDRLPGLQRTADQVGVRVMARHDEDRVQATRPRARRPRWSRR